MAPHLGDPDGQLEAERGRLGVDAVRAPDHQRALVRHGLAREHRLQAVQVASQHIGSLEQLDRQAVSSTSEEVSPRWI